MALIYQCGIGVILVIGTWLGWFNLYGLLAIMFFFLLGQGLTGPNAAALSLAPFSKHAGSAASLLGAFRMAMAGIVTALVSAFHNDTTLPMVGIMVFCAFIGLFILTTGKASVRYRVGKMGMDEESSVIL